MSRASQRPLFRTYHFKPDRVEGMPEVTEVFVDPTGLELKTPAAWVDVRFADIAVSTPPRWYWKLMARIGLRRGRPAVGEWLTSPGESSPRLAFFTTPRLVVELPASDPALGLDTFAQRIEAVVALGGYRIWGEKPLSRPR